MKIKKKYWIFDIFKGKFEEGEQKGDNINEFIDVLRAEKAIARKMIIQKLSKIEPKDFKESRD